MIRILGAAAMSTRPDDLPIGGEITPFCQLRLEGVIRLDALCPPSYSMLELPITFRVDAPNRSMLQGPVIRALVGHYLKDHSNT